MTVFPTNHERLITFTIVAFLAGCMLVFFASASITEINILLPALATLVAAFVGAWAAYKLEDNKKKREYKEKCLEKANNILFSLYERAKSLRVFQKQSIVPHRNDPFIMISMMPMLNFSDPDSKFDVDTLLFLLSTKHSQLMLDLHTEKESFREAFKLIRFRSNLHLKHVQPAMEAGGIQLDVEYTRQQMIDVIGERIFEYLEKSTNEVVKMVDETIVSSEIIKTRLVDALKELFPEQKVLDFGFKDIMPNNAPQTDAAKPRG